MMIRRVPIGAVNDHSTVRLSWADPHMHLTQRGFDLAEPLLTSTVTMFDTTDILQVGSAICAPRALAAPAWSPPRSRPRAFTVVAMFTPW
jgi:hypothetical protein